MPKAYVCGVSTIRDYFRAMFGPFGDPVLLCFTSALVWALKFARLTQHGIRHISMNYLLFETMSGLLDHFGAMLGLPRDWRFSRLSQHDLRKILWGVYFLHHVRAMFKPCLNSVWPCFSSRAVRHPKLSSLSQHDMECLLLRTMFGPRLYNFTWILVQGF